MASKTTDNQVLYGEIRWEFQLLIMKDVSNIVAREEEHTQGPAWIEKKPSKMEDDEWDDIDFHAKVTIILCISDEVLYNVMNEETIAGLL